MAAITTTYYTLNDCCTGQPYIVNDQILCFVYTGLCEPGTCPQDLLSLIITSVSSEATPDYITGCFNLTQVQSVPPGAFTTNYLNAIASVETVSICEECQTCPVYYTLNDCCTNQPINWPPNEGGLQGTLYLEFDGTCYEGEFDNTPCPNDLTNLIITEVLNEAQVNITGCLKLTSVSITEIPVGADIDEWENIMSEVSTVPTCAECQECCYKLTNCETDEIIYSNTSTLIQHFGNTVTLNGQEGCWEVGISAGNCDCLTVTITTAETSGNYTANAIGTYSGYNLYEYQIGEETYYIWSVAQAEVWYITQGGYGEDEDWPLIAEIKFNGECPDSITEGFSWIYYISGDTLTTEQCPAECDCPIPVTVLQSFEDCPSCLPIVAYKFTNCNNQTLVQYSTEDYSEYVGKTVELECGDCWFVSQIDYTPPSTQTITILYTFDSCIACNRTYYKLTDCLDPNNVTYTYTDLSALFVSTVQQDCTECINVAFKCNNVDYSFDLPVTGTNDGKRKFRITNISICNYANADIEILWAQDPIPHWSFAVLGTEISSISNDTECPFGSYPNSSAIEVPFTNIVVAPCAVPPVIKIKGCDSCFTVEETREPINAGIVTVTDSFIDCPECLETFPCVCNRITNQDTIAKDFTYLDCLFEEVTINLQPNETSDKVCLINWVLSPEEEALVYIEHFGDCVNGQCSAEPLPKRKVKPGYSTPSCDIEKYEKITCKSSEIYYKQVLRLRYGLSNCCPEDEEKWLVKKELIDLDALRDPDYVCQPVTSCCGQTINTCGCGCNQTLKTCNS
jgi:hypothetical protein